MQVDSPYRMKQPSRRPSSAERLRTFQGETLQAYYGEEVCEVDRFDISNPQQVAEYANEIFTFLHAKEGDFLPRYGYMKQQTDINEKMRAILVDWLIEVHLKFKLLPETLFLTVNLIDRFLELEVVMRQKLQLVGVTAMLIASKYEEIYAPEVRDFVYITDKAYTKEEVLDMEYHMLTRLDFNCTTPSSFRFLQRYAKVAQADELSFNLAQYLIELPLIEYKMLRYSPSMVAAAALYVSLRILKRELNWEEQLQQFSHLHEAELRPCAKDLCVLLHGIDKIAL